MADGISMVTSLTFNRLPEITAMLHEGASKAVRKTAFDIAAQAQSLAAVDTGAMKNAVYVETKDDSSYGNAVSGASANPRANVLDEVEKPANDLTAYVAEGMEYGIYQEYGTVKMAAHPYMTPAAEGARGDFLDAMSHLVDG